MLVYLRLLSESFSFAMNALRNNKLRTLLSLLGVTIGIFSIIAILAAVDSLDRKIKKDLSSLDKNTIYLFRHSFGFRYIFGLFPHRYVQWNLRNNCGSRGSASAISEMVILCAGYWQTVP